MHLLEQAAHDVIGVVSLGLQELSQRDPAKALALLQAPEGPIKPFQKGWSMLWRASSSRRAVWRRIGMSTVPKYSIHASIASKG